jgi:hypothetical protein
VVKRVLGSTEKGDSRDLRTNLKAELDKWRDVAFNMARKEALRMDRKFPDLAARARYTAEEIIEDEILEIKSIEKEGAR